MSIASQIQRIQSEIPPHVKLVAVTKTHPANIVQEAYDAGLRAFGENRVQEMIAKQPLLPADSEWHLIGHLQTNKVKYIAPFVSMIQSVDSLKLLQEINKNALKHNRMIHCLLQVFIASEETKFGLSFKELDELLNSKEFSVLKNVKAVGLMGMASLTDDLSQVRKEFSSLRNKFDQLKGQLPEFSVLSMGMSSDYKIAIEEGSTLVRIGSSIFGHRT